MQPDDFFWRYSIWNYLYRFLLCIPFANIIVYYIYLIRVFGMYGKLPEVVLDRFPTLEIPAIWLFLTTLFTFLATPIVLLFLVREKRYVGPKWWGQLGLLIYPLWLLHCFFNHFMFFIYD